MKPASEVQRFDAVLRVIVRKLRKLLDAADEHVHAWEMLLRAPVVEEYAAGQRGETRYPRETRSPLADKPRGVPRVQRRTRRGMTAAEFDRSLMDRRLAR